MAKLIYKFSHNACDGNSSMLQILGGKGAHLAEMCTLKFPIPPGFTIATNAKEIGFEAIKQNIHSHIGWLEKLNKKKFGDTNAQPLLLSVRSGAAASMPGMMDTVLNLGLNDDTVTALAQVTNQRFALDSYRRFIAMFSNIVLEIDAFDFESELTTIKFQKRLTYDYELTTDSLNQLIANYKALVLEKTGHPFPQDVHQQLQMAIEAVWDSWDNQRAATYRKHNNINHLTGTAVNVQSMVFGNLNETSLTGVVFTRNPATGAEELYGEYLINAQGEDIVSGVRTPHPIHGGEDSLKNNFPQIFKELKQKLAELERHYADMQDVEFTVEDGVLYILQTRSAKRTVSAAVKVAYDFAKNGKISKEEAIMRLPADEIHTLFYETLAPDSNNNLLFKGLPASPGAVTGAVVFSSEEAKQYQTEHDVILLRDETSPDDLEGIIASVGVITTKGGITSHAAVVARGMGKPCITGASTIQLNCEDGIAKTDDGQIITRGDIITIDGATGQVVKGKAAKIKQEVGDEFYHILNWARELKTMDIKTNAESLSDIKNAIAFGAEGIGLCRTEHMFLENSRLQAIRCFILAPNQKTQEAALSDIYKYQKEDFTEILKLLNGLPISVRLLDPPLHEFLPKKQVDIAEIATHLGISETKVRESIDKLRESNPMLGHRGVRLGMTHPQLFKAQIDALAAAAIEVKGADIEIMLPLVNETRELTYFTEYIHERFKESAPKTKYKVGTMIETPKAAITANKLAPFVDFFSFGTNDLTQTTLGISRDDAADLLLKYVEWGIFAADPFVSIERDGVGYLLQLATGKGRAANPNLQIGICGEHGGDHNSIQFFQKLGFDYISCSPYRITGATISAAQAAINAQNSAANDEAVANG